MYCQASSINQSLNLPCCQLAGKEAQVHSVGSNSLETTYILFELPQPIGVGQPAQPAAGINRDCVVGIAARNAKWRNVGCTLRVNAAGAVTATPEKFGSICERDVPTTTTGQPISFQTL